MKNINHTTNFTDPQASFCGLPPKDLNLVDWDKCNCVKCLEWIITNIPELEKVVPEWTNANFQKALSTVKDNHKKLTYEEEFSELIQGPE